MSDSTASHAPGAAAGAASEEASESAFKSLAGFDTEATVTFHGAANLNDLLQLASRHCRRLVDCTTARIWLLRRNGRRLVARDFPDEREGGPVEHRMGRGEGL